MTGNEKGAIGLILTLQAAIPITPMVYVNRLHKDGREKLKNYKKL